MRDATQAELDYINAEISKLPNYDPKLKIMNVKFNHEGIITEFFPNETDSNGYFLAKELMEEAGF